MLRSLFIMFLYVKIITPLHTLDYDLHEKYCGYATVKLLIEVTNLKKKNKTIANENIYHVCMLRTRYMLHFVLNVCTFMHQKYDESVK